MTFVRMLLSLIFSPDSCEVFACFLKTVARLSYNICMSVMKILHRKFAKISGQQVRDTHTNVVRLSCTCHTTVTRVLPNISEKKFAYNF